MANQGRPVCSMGNTPAQDTAKTVIASAARLMDVRQFCRNRNRIAEINVPACPMPTQNTKFTMKEPQSIRLLMPTSFIPTVWTKIHTHRYRNSAVWLKENPTQNPREPQRSEGAHTSRLTSCKVLPPVTNGRRSCRDSWVALMARLQGLWVRRLRAGA